MPNPICRRLYRHPESLEAVVASASGKRIALPDVLGRVGVLSLIQSVLHAPAVKPDIPNGIDRLQSLSGNGELLALGRTSGEIGQVWLPSEDMLPFPERVRNP